MTVNWWCGVAVLLYWWSGVVLVVTAASSTPAGRRLRLQPRRPGTGGDALVGNGVVLVMIISSSTPAGRCRGRNPGVGLFLYSTTPL
jgi:hypothetical protein